MPAVYASLAKMKLTQPALEDGPAGAHITLAAEPGDEGVLRLDQEEKMVAELRAHLESRDLGRTGAKRSGEKESCVVVSTLRLPAHSVVSPGPTPGLNRDHAVCRTASRLPNRHMCLTAPLFDAAPIRRPYFRFPAVTPLVRTYQTWGSPTRDSM